MKDFVEDAEGEWTREDVYRELTTNYKEDDGDLEPLVNLAKSEDANLENIVVEYLEKLHIEDPEESDLLALASEESNEIARKVTDDYDRFTELIGIENSEDYREIREKILED